MSIELMMPFNHLILSPPSPPAFSLSHHQGLFQWVSSSHQMAKVLELQLQHQSLQRIFRADFLQDWLVWSPCCPRDSQESSSLPQFENINSSVLNLLYSPTLKLFNVLSKFVVAVLPRSKHLLTLCGQFLKSYWICCNIASVLCFGFLALRHMESFFPWMEPTPPALEVEVLTTEPPGKSLDIIYFNMLNPPQGACYLLTQMVSLLWLYNSYLHFLLYDRIS